MNLIQLKFLLVDNDLGLDYQDVRLEVQENLQDESVFPLIRFSFSTS